MILFLKLILTCVIIFPFSQFFCSAAWESNLNAIGNFSNIRILDDDCRYLLESFASSSGKYTYCAINSARPITLCQDCVKDYLESVNVHGDILELKNKANEACKQKLINLDRLQIVEGGFAFIDGLWKRAKCDTCYNLDSRGHPTKLKPEIAELLELHNKTITCIDNHQNDSVIGLRVTDRKVCYECKDQYLELNERYNNLELRSPICMDIKDMLNTTRQLWSVGLECCLDRKTPEYIFLISSGFISVLPVLFYLLACTFAGKKEQFVVLRTRSSIPYPGYVPSTPGIDESIHDDISRIRETITSADDVVPEVSHSD